MFDRDDIDGYVLTDDIDGEGFDYIDEFNPIYELIML